MISVDGSSARGEISALPGVHTIILNYNGWRDTISCLESVFGIDDPPIRVIVCDNGSTDDSWQHLVEWASARLPAYAILMREEAERGASVPAEARLILIRMAENLGFSGGNNVGLRFVAATTSGGYVWLLNNDMIVEPHALRHMVVMAEAEPRLAVVGATLYDFDQPDVVQEAGGGRLTRWSGLVRLNGAGAARGAGATGERLDYVSGGCMLVRRQMLDTIGLLDEQFFFYREDTDWCLRIHEHGLALGYCPEAGVRHKGSATAGRRSPFKDYHIVRSSLLLTRKHAPHMLWPAIFHGLFRFVLPKVVRREWDRLRAVIRGYLAYHREVKRAGRG